MIIYLTHGETFENQQLLINVKASGVLLSYKILSQKSDEYTHKLLSGYENYAAIMIELDDGPEKYLEWASRFYGYNNIAFLEPRLSNEESAQLRKRALRQLIPLIPVWRSGCQTHEDFENMCKEYQYVAVEGVMKKQQFMELLRIAYPYNTKLHAHSITKRHTIVKTTILKNLPLASASCINWRDASRVRYVFDFSPAKRELGYKPYNVSTNKAEMDEASAFAWSQYSIYLDSTQWKYWLDEEQQRFKGNKHTSKIKNYIIGNNRKTSLNNDRQRLRSTDDPELIADLAERARGVGKTFRANQGGIRHILKTNGLIENRRRIGHEGWLWDQRAEAAIFKNYMQWAGPSGFNQHWLDYVEENHLTDANDIARAGKKLYEKEAGKTLSEGYIRAAMQCNRALAGIRPKFSKHDDEAIALVSFIHDGEYLPRRPWLRKSKNRPEYR